MVWAIEFDERARRELRKLDPAIQREILRYLRLRVAAKDARSSGKPLRHAMKGLWRYRIGGCRVICRIEDDRFVVLVLAIGHRREIYDRG